MASPAGRTCGHRGGNSVGVFSAGVTFWGLPPAAGTRMSLPFWLPVGFNVSVKKIVPSGPQLPILGFILAQTEMGVPPCNGAFFNWPPAVKAIHSPSGEKNGPPAPPVPGINRSEEHTSELPSLTKLLFR